MSSRGFAAYLPSNVAVKTEGLTVVTNWHANGEKGLFDRNLFSQVHGTFRAPSTGSISSVHHACMP